MDKPFFKWKVEAMCDNCPFATEGQGLVLQQSLGQRRWDGILTGLLKGDKFPCHKTTKETGNGTDLYCAGALEFQCRLKIETPYMKLCRSFEGTRENKKTMFNRLLNTARQRRKKHGVG